MSGVEASDPTGLPERGADTPPLPESCLAGGDLVRIRYRYQIPSECILTLPLSTERAFDSTASRLFLFEDYFKGGLRIPIHPFVISVFRLFNVSPTQLLPNSYRNLSAFISRCAAVGVPPSLSVFRTLFTLKDHPANKGFLYFSARLGQGIFRGLPSSIHGWKKRYFLISCPGHTWPFPPGWPRYNPEANQAPELTEAEEADLAKIRDGIPEMAELLSEEALARAKIVLGTAGSSAEGQWREGLARMRQARSPSSASLKKAAKRRSAPPTQGLEIAVLSEGGGEAAAALEGEALEETPAGGDSTAAEESPSARPKGKKRRRRLVKACALEATPLSASFPGGGDAPVDALVGQMGPALEESREDLEGGVCQARLMTPGEGEAEDRAETMTGSAPAAEAEPVEEVRELPASTASPERSPAIGVSSAKASPIDLSSAGDDAASPEGWSSPALGSAEADVAAEPAAPEIPLPPVSTTAEVPEMAGRTPETAKSQPAVVRRGVAPSLPDVSAPVQPPPGILETDSALFGPVARRLVESICLPRDRAYFLSKSPGDLLTEQCRHLCELAHSIVAMARRNEALEGSVQDLQESAQHGEERNMEAFEGLQGAMDRLRELHAQAEGTLRKKEEALQWYRPRLRQAEKNYIRARREAKHAEGLADDRLVARQRAEQRLREVERKSSEEVAGLQREASRLSDEVERMRAANRALLGKEALLEKQVREAEGVHLGLMAEIDILKKDSAKMGFAHKKALSELADEIRRRDDCIAQGQAREDELRAELENLRSGAAAKEDLLQREKRELSERVDILEAEKSALETRASEIGAQASAELQKAAVEAYKRSQDFQGILTAHGSQAFSEGFEYCKAKIIGKFPNLGVDQVTISSSSEDEAGSGSDFED